jgi:hypothetical protein
LGSWFGGTRYLEGFNAGDTLNLQVRVWEVNFAATYEEAEHLVASGNYLRLLGKSFVFNYTIETVGPPDAGAMRNFQGFYVTLVPEPSSMTLLLFAGAGIVAYRFFYSKRP